MQFIRHFLLAMQFFTRIPITGRLASWVGYSPGMLRASAAHFAGIGWVVGSLAATTYGVLVSTINSAYAPLVAAVLSTVATVMLTGGFHEDGLADVADGLGGTYAGNPTSEAGDPTSDAGIAQRTRALDIMKDSRVGAFGAMALVLALLAKVALLAALADATSGVGGIVVGSGLGTGLAGVAAGVAAAGVSNSGADPSSLPGLYNLPVACLLILCAHVVSRACPMVLVRVLAHVGDTASSKSKPLADQIGLGALLSNFLWCFGLIPLVIYAQAAIIFVAACAAALLALCWMWRLFAQRLQGFTGDCLGATQQVCELAFYLGALWAM